MSTDAPLSMELFTDFVCPWCYLGNAVLGKLRETTPIALKRTPFPLHPSTPPEGMLLSQMLPGMDIDSVHQRLYAIMDEIGLEHGERVHTYNTRLAQELALWADTQGKGEALDALLYKAYFVHDQNIALPEVLLPLVEAAGLDVAVASQVISERSFSDQCDAAWQRARQFNISGVPSFVAGGYATSGYMPLAEMQRFVEYIQGQQKTAAV